MNLHCSQHRHVGRSFCVWSKSQMATCIARCSRCWTEADFENLSFLCSKLAAWQNLVEVVKVPLSCRCRISVARGAYLVGRQYDRKELGIESTMPLLDHRVKSCDYPGQATEPSDTRRKRCPLISLTLCLLTSCKTV